jgi:hypothetical protein
MTPDASGNNVFTGLTVMLTRHPPPAPPSVTASSATRYA